MTYSVSDSYGSTALYPYRYFTFSPTSGSYSETGSVTVSFSLKLYDSSSWSGSLQSIDSVVVYYLDSSGSFLDGESISFTKTLSSPSGSVTFSLSNATSSYKSTASYIGVLIETTVYTSVSGNTATQTTPVADSSTNIPVFTLTHVTACTAPTSVSVASTNVAPGASVKLSWSGATAGTGNAITGYEVYRATSASGTYSKLTTVTTTSTSGSTTVTAPTTSGSSYYYKVLTVGTVSGYSSGQSSVYATLTCKYTAPTAPTSISVSNSTPEASASVTLSWSGAAAGTNNAITGYDIYRSTSSSGTYSKLTSVTTTATSGSASVTAPSTMGSSYYYKIYTLGTYSNSSISTTYATVTAKSYTACGAPTSFSCSPTLTDSTTILSWSGATNGTNNTITSYELQYCESSDGSTWGDWKALITVTSTETSGTKGISASATYGNYRKFRIRTLGSAGSSYYSGWTETSNTVRRKWAPFDSWTDETLTAKVTKIRAIHLTELQTRINTIRPFYDLDSYSFTTITAGVTKISKWATLIGEIRTAIDEITTDHDSWNTLEVGKPRIAHITQLRSIIDSL